MTDSFARKLAFVAISQGGGGSSKSAILVANVASGSSFPTKRADNSSLVVGDFITPSSSATFPFTISSITFSCVEDKAVWNGKQWLYQGTIPNNTANISVAVSPLESISGNAKTQQEVNKEMVNKFIQQREIMKKMIQAEEDGTSIKDLWTYQQAIDEVGEISSDIYHSVGGK